MVMTTKVIRCGLRVCENTQIQRVDDFSYCYFGDRKGDFIRFLCVTCVEFMYLCRHVSVILVLLMCVMVLFCHDFDTFVIQMYFTHMLVTQSCVTQ